MPWQECHVMDERVRFVARLLEGEKMAPLCAELAFRGRRATRSSSGTRTAASERLATAVADRFDRPTGSRRSSKRRLCGSSASIPAGARRRSAKSCASSSPVLIYRRSARSTLSSTGTGWSTTAGGTATERRAPRCHGRPSRMPSGARTIKANSCSAIGGTAIR